MPKRRPNDESPLKADLLPVMNVMFLLIPALVLAMEFASMAEIRVSLPRMIYQPPRDLKRPPPLDFRVMIGSDGFHTYAAGARASDATIPRKGGAYDYAALAATASHLKQRFPAEVIVKVTAEGDVPLQVLVSTLDTLTGEDCKLGAIMARGEYPGDACLFWSPIVESGANWRAR